MEVHFNPELETRLQRSPPKIVAIRMSTFNNSPNTISTMTRGLAQLDRGEYLAHEEVEERIEQMFRS
jgi:hypothetical protein